MKDKLIPLAVAFACYISLHFLQFFVIFPMEVKYGSSVTWLASIFFFPHLVRVIAVWMLGPMAFFGLLPADIIIHFMLHPDRSITDIQMLVPFVSSACAVLAFEIFRMTGFDLYMESTDTSNWKPVMLVGAIASVFNSIGLSLLYAGLVISEDGLKLLVNYAIGDTLGLFFGMLILLLIAKTLRLGAQPS